MLDFFHNQSLRTKVISTFLLATLLSIGAFALLNNRSTATQLTDQTGQSLEHLAVSTGLNTGTTLDRMVEALQSFSLGRQVHTAIDGQNMLYLAQYPTKEDIEAELQERDREWYSHYREESYDDFPLMQDRLNNALAQDLRRLQRAFPEFLEVIVTDRHGGLVAASAPIPDYYQADELWWQQTYNQEDARIYIGNPLPRRSQQAGVHPIIQVGIPIYRHADENMDRKIGFIGVLGVTLDTKPLADLLRAAAVGESGTVELRLGRSNFMFGPVDGKYRLYNVYDETDANVLSEIRNNTQGFTQMPLRGSEKFIAYAPVTTVEKRDFIEDLNWQVLIYQEEAEALAVLRQIFRNTGLLATGIAALVIAVGVIMGQQVADPIRRLSTAMTRFTEGELDTRVKVMRKDETGILAQRFNEMADQVSNLLERLENRRRELEERTSQLDANQRAISVIFEASKQSSPEELLGLVVNMIRDRFNLYHVQIYMVDEEQDVAVLRESTGYAGRQLLQQNHKLSLDQKSLVTKAININEAVNIPDVRESDEYLPNPLLVETKSEAVVPLRLDTRVIGALDVQSSTVGEFDEDLVTLFQTMADHIALLFENSELLNQVSEQNRALTRFTTQIRTAADLGQRLTTIHEPAELLHETVELIQTRFGFYHVHIYLLDEEREELVVDAGSGEVGTILRQEGHSIDLNAERSLVAQAARTRTSVVANDVSESPDYLANPLLPQTRAEIAVPLVVRDVTLGVLDVQDDTINRFTESDVRALNTLAGQVASALHTAQLFEEVQKTAERLREVDRLKSEFLANMSHELRTPLNSIIGYAEILLMGLDGELDDETRKDVQAIYENGQHLLNLINDILDLAKIEAGHMTLDKQEVRLDTLLQEVKTSHVGVLQQKQKDLDLIVDVETAVPPIQADYARLNQVLNNLVSNAIKFTDSGEIRMRASTDNGWVCLEIEDTGAGISPEDQRHIFERFRQADGSKSRVAEGTGLGLAITQHLVEMHGGTIDLESELGIGSTFTIRLPLDDPDGEETEA